MRSLTLNRSPRPGLFSQLRVRLLILMVFILMPALVLAVYTASEQVKNTSFLAREEALLLAQLAASNQEQIVEGARQLLIAVSQIPEVRNGDSAACNVLLND